MGRAIIQGSGIQYSITINLSCWLLSSALISNSLNVDKMCQYHWFSHQNNKKQANKNIYNTSYLCGSLIQLVNHENFNLDKPSWAPPLPYMPEFADVYPLFRDMSFQDTSFHYFPLVSTGFWGCTTSGNLFAKLLMPSMYKSQSDLGCKKHLHPWRQTLEHYSRKSLNMLGIFLGK